MSWGSGLLLRPDLDGVEEWDLPEPVAATPRRKLRSPAIERLRPQAEADLGDESAVEAFLDVAEAEAAKEPPERKLGGPLKTRQLDTATPFERIGQAQQTIGELNTPEAQQYLGDNPLGRLRGERAISGSTAAPTAESLAAAAIAAGYVGGAAVGGPFGTGVAGGLATTLLGEEAVRQGIGLVTGEKPSIRQYDEEGRVRPFGTTDIAMEAAGQAVGPAIAAVAPQLARAAPRIGRTAGAVTEALAGPRPNVLRIAAKADAIAPAEEGLAGSRGAMQVVDPAGVRVLKEGEALAEGETEFFHGTAGRLRPGEIKPGTFLTPSAEDAAGYAGVTSRIEKTQAPLGRLRSRLRTEGELGAATPEAFGAGALRRPGPATDNPYRRGPLPTSYREMLSRESTMPRATSARDIRPTGGSEAELNAYSSAARSAETTPPVVPDVPVGSYRRGYEWTDGRVEVDQLQGLRLNDPIVHVPEDSFAKNPQTLQKYVDWLRSGHRPPPVNALEVRDPNTGALKRIDILDGAHRVRAIREVYGDDAPIEAWVSLTDVDNPALPVYVRGGNSVSRPAPIRTLDKRPAAANRGPRMRPSADPEDGPLSDLERQMQASIEAAAGARRRAPLASRAETPEAPTPATTAKQGRSELTDSLRASLRGKKPEPAERLTVAEMRAKLDEAGLDSSGTRAVIVNRYRGYVAGEAGGIGPNARPENVANAARAAYQETLEATGDPEAARLAGRRAAAQEKGSQQRTGALSRLADAIKRGESGVITPEGASFGLTDKLGRRKPMLVRPGNMTKREFDKLQRQRLGGGGVMDRPANRLRDVAELTDEMSVAGKGLRFDPGLLEIPDRNAIKERAAEIRKAPRGRGAEEGATDAQLFAFDTLQNNDAPRAFSMIGDELATTAGSTPRNRGYIAELQRIHDRLYSVGESYEDLTFNWDALVEGRSRRVVSARPNVRPTMTQTQRLPAGGIRAAPNVAPVRRPPLRGMGRELVREYRAGRAREFAADLERSRGARPPEMTPEEYAEALAATRGRPAEGPIPPERYYGTAQPALGRTPPVANVETPPAGPPLSQQRLNRALQEPDTGIRGTAGGGDGIPPRGPEGQATFGHMPEPIQDKSVGGFLSNLFGAAAASKRIQTTGDIIGGQLRQGLPVAFIDPKVWGRNTARSIRAYLEDPEAQDVWREVENLPRFKPNDVRRQVHVIDEYGDDRYFAVPSASEIFGIGKDFQTPGFEKLGNSTVERLGERYADLIGNMGTRSEKSLRVGLVGSGTELYNGMVDSAVAAGIDNPEVYKHYGDLARWAVGYGDVPQALKGLSNGFYSLRNTTARFQMAIAPILKPGPIFRSADPDSWLPDPREMARMRSIFSASPRGVATKNLVRFAAGEIANLRLLAAAGKHSGLFEVGYNPLEPGFGRLTFEDDEGNDFSTDLLGGYGSLIKATAHTAYTAQEIAQGKTKPDEWRFDPAVDWVNFGRYKMSGVPAAFVDTAIANSGLGNVEGLQSPFAMNLLDPKFWTTGKAFNFITPFFAQDSIQGLIQGELDPTPEGLFKAGGLMLAQGAGVPTNLYPATSTDVREDALPAAVEAGAVPEGVPLDELGSGERDALDRYIVEQGGEAAEKLQRPSTSIFGRKAERRKEIDAEYAASYERLLADLQSGRKDSREVGEALIKLRSEAAGRTQELYADRAYQRIIERLPENDMRRLENDYFNITGEVAAGRKIPELTEEDWDEIDERQQRFVANLPDDVRGRFENNLAQRDSVVNAPPLIKLKREADAVSEDYYALQQQQRRARERKVEYKGERPEDYLRANPDVDVARWQFYGQALQTVQAADAVLADAGRRPVKFAGIDGRAINATPATRRAWEVSKGPVAWYLSAGTEENRDDFAQARFGVPYARLDADDKESIRNTIKTQMRRDPEMAAWLLYWGVIEKAPTEEIAAAADALRRRYR